jgi:hypothetical protein
MRCGTGSRSARQAGTVCALTGVSGFILLAQPTIYGLIALFPSADIKVLTG